MKNRGIIITLSTIGVVILLGLMSYVSATNRGNRMEKQVLAQWETVEQTYGKYGQKIAELAQVPTMQADDMARVFKETNAARYGENGADGMMVWIQEQNPNLDSAVYTQIQREISAGRNELKVENKKLTDTRTSYAIALDNFWGGMWMGMAGWPTIDLDKYKAISTDRASAIMDAGKESAPIKLR